MFVDPITKKKLVYSSKENAYSNDSFSYKVEDDVVIFLEKEDDFYEGAYQNRIRYNPAENSIGILPLWLLSNNYVWEVRKQFPPKSTLLELGCASGVDYFGTRYEMIGLDLSFTSLKGAVTYKHKLQADATKLPLADNSVDGVISSYFWEHIPHPIKIQMLSEIQRVLKPGGKIVFLYDVETKNTLLQKLKDKDNNATYKRLFLDKDGHFGYETPAQNKTTLENAGFNVLKHFGMERSWVQSTSVYSKLRNVSGLAGIYGSFMFFLTKFSITTYLNIFFVLTFDHSFGRLIDEKKSRIILSVAQKK